MQAISKAKHKLLYDSILNLECLIESIDKNSEDLIQAAQYRQELTGMYKNYEQMLTNLAVLIADYEALFTQIKSNLIGRKLKELKKEIRNGEPAFRKLTENIQLSYGT